MSLLFIIDSPHVVYRACHANAELVCERHGKEVRTGGVFGYLQMVRLAHSRLGDGDALVVAAFEDPQRNQRSARRALYPPYKIHTKPDEEIDYGRIELAQFVRDQVEMLQPILSKIGIPCCYAPAWEADDVIATLCTQLSDHDVVVFTGDKDMMQLVSDRVAVMRPLKEGYQLVTPKVWEEEHRVPVSQWAQVLALAGDDSDMIPGVRGVGFKTAEKLLREHGDLEEVIAAAAAGQVKRFSEAITAMVDQLRLNLKLTTLNSQVDLNWTQPERDEDEVAHIFRELKLHTFTGYGELLGIMEMGCDGWG